jgi:hypothetical protein
LLAFFPGLVAFASGFAGEADLWGFAVAGLGDGVGTTTAEPETTVIGGVVTVTGVVAAVA